MRDIEKLLVDSSKLRSENGEIPVMFQKAKYKAENGQAYKMYYMNRDGFSLLVMGFNGKSALKWKIKYIGAFNQMEQLLTEKQSLPWQEARSLSKQIHKQETDAIKLLVEYAQSQGSQNAKRYYTNISTLANKAARIEDGNRNNASMSQLGRLILIENVILDCIQEGIRQQLPYKGIYRKCRERIEQFGTLAG
jgi:Rha family phage regulatory protein